MSVSSSFTLKNYDSQMKAKSAAAERIVILYLRAHCIGVLFFFYMLDSFSCITSMQRMESIVHINIAKRAMRTLFIFIASVQKSNVCLLLLLHALCFFLVCVHVSAHHFHPFYGFKINQKIRLELFCCVVFSTHYLFCCCYDVFFI